MSNRTDGMQHDTTQRLAESTQASTAQRTPRPESGTTPSVDKAEDMIALLANRIRRNEARS